MFPFSLPYFTEFDNRFNIILSKNSLSIAINISSKSGSKTKFIFFLLIYSEEASNIFSTTSTTLRTITFSSICPSDILLASMKLFIVLISLKQFCLITRLFLSIELRFLFSIFKLFN